MSNDSLYQKSNFNRIGEFKKLSSEAFRAFGNFDQKALSEGLLNSKVKELMAVAIAHVTGCPYCIEVGNGIKSRLFPCSWSKCPKCL
ncbi:carboxymuconolactone decarboxylase family protein [Priestia endophytica]|uniref:carboxymuconolactone decarboxylase family protein n=1 Tax=Priestia endophytica TaxID=135735 RepID=UPI0030EC92E9